MAGVHEIFIIETLLGGLDLDVLRHACENLTRESIHVGQLERLNQLLKTIGDRPFYRNWFGEKIPSLSHLDELHSLPLLTKSDLIADGEITAGLLFDLSRESYTRFHQTSGTKGFPMVVLDTTEDWQWWLLCWQFVLDAAEVTRKDVAMMAFSFGPFIGFWTAHDALAQRGALVVPGGGLSSENRLRMIRDQRCTLLCCTPTYALHLLSVADSLGMKMRDSSINRVIVAGEPGGSIESVREKIESGWGATVIDHCGASEVGAWGFGERDGGGIHVIETEFIAEVLRVDEANPRGVPVKDGERGELVLTNLGRLGGPVVRYRTGDIVEAYRQHSRRCPFLWLKGGVLGRCDDMLVIRGVNVFPSSIESIIRETFAYTEFRMTASRSEEMDQLQIEVEVDEFQAELLARTFRDRLSLRVDVKSVEVGSLPRFEAKAKRLVDSR